MSAGAVMRKRLEAAVQKRFRSQGKAPLATRGWPKAKFHHNPGGFRWASTGWGRVGGRPHQGTHGHIQVRASAAS